MNKKSINLGINTLTYVLDMCARTGDSSSPLFKATTEKLITLINKL